MSSEDDAAFLARKRAVQAARAARALAMSLERSDRIRRGIVLALGQLQTNTDRWDLVRVVSDRINRHGPARYGLTKVPHDTTIRPAIRDELEQRRRTAVPVQEPSHFRAAAFYASTSSSS